MAMIELRFSVRGTTLPTDHAYLLFAALSHVVREFHDEQANLRFSPINGDRGEKGTIRLADFSRLSVRLSADQISVVLALAGQTLELGRHRITLKQPTVQPIIPAPTLAAKLVTFKYATDPDQFLTTARRKLDEIGVDGDPGIPLIQQGQRAGEPRRQVLRIKGLQIIAYALQVAGLKVVVSLRLLEGGLGGRRRIGCGFFVPVSGRNG